MSQDLTAQDPAHESPIQSIDELVALLASGEKPRDRWRLGIEYEALLFRRGTLAPVAYEAQVRPLLWALCQLGWRQQGTGQLVALTRAGAHITLEPGGQIELSGAPHGSVEDCARELLAYIADLDAVLPEFDLLRSAIALRPNDTPDTVHWMPRKRHQRMREYLPERGRKALHMMLMTATAQANVDYADEADMVRKLRCAMIWSPVVAALCANSPYEQGAFTGYRSSRYAVWREVDPDRCGFLRCAFDDDFGYRRYVEYALDVPLLFVLHDGEYHKAPRATFRELLRTGYQGRAMTPSDFSLHLSGLFPEVRLKSYLELRSADTGSPATALALGALWKGLLYDQVDAGLAALSALSFEDLLAMQLKAAQWGLSGHGRNWSFREIASDLLRLARSGLSAEEAAFLAPLETIAHSGVTRADALLARFGAGPLTAEDLARVVTET